MAMSPLWRTRFATIAAGLLAVWIGGAVASESLLLPSVVAGAMLVAILVALQPLPIPTLLLGLVCVGYIAGNRGFAQLSLSSRLPLLPAETVLLISAGFLLVKAALTKRLPFRRDTLNVLVLGWMVVASVRLFHDVRVFGAMAIRDYAMVYYAAFFFLGQAAAGELAGRRFVERCLLAGCVLLGLVYPLFVTFPDFFLTRLTVRQVPLIFFKGDLAGTFLAIGSVLCFLRFETKRSWLALGCSIAFAAGTVLTNNRASLLALFAAAALLAVARRWRFAALQLAAGAAAAVVLVLVAQVQHKTWRETPLLGVYERVSSVFDPLGQRTYSAADAANKGDNNLFRMVWWRTVIDETIDGGPVFGLGFGADLAERFVQEYYSDSPEEFSTRSPHNILLTVFARTGAVGLVPFLAIIGVVIVQTIKAARRDVSATGPWLVGCALFVSACFGVVLEGPMGAVVFWTALGAANAAGDQGTTSNLHSEARLVTERTEL